MDLRNGEKAIKVVVGMGTCGIAAGARPVMAAIKDELARKSVQNVTVVQSGCAGFCEQEPLMDIFRPGEKKVTYGKVSPDKARKIVVEHILGGRVVNEFVFAQEK
ncbi:MAG: (2Fe-2S) ferredoxin domain-containing protein [Deltaproteobacteria bacterium]|nr:(2Fe-2S) ferredoxin domain-containing protein [Deltaproteobacteria bacterium]